MSGLFASGNVVDLILAIIALEAAFLLARTRLRPLDIALALGPGVCLLLALRSALTGADWRWTAAALAASFPLHLLDLIRRSSGRR